MWPLLFSAHANFICTGLVFADAAAGKITAVISMTTAAARAADSTRNPGKRRIPSMTTSPDRHSPAAPPRIGHDRP